MAWYYEISAGGSPAHKAARREALDYYGMIAYYSTFAPPVLFILCRLVAWAFASSKRGNGSYEPLSVRRAHAQGQSGAGVLAKVKWWLAEPVFLGPKRRGRRDQWVFGFAWAAWLLILSIKGTGNDYLHLTKRFGIIAASQLPAQHLLSLKALNPYALTLRSSHEDLNRYHRTLARVMLLFLLLHVGFYLNFFVQANLLPGRLFDKVVVVGVLANMSFMAMYATALPKVREYSYRLFFIVHLLVVFAVPGLLFLHAKPARGYVLQSVAFIVLDLMVRKFVVVKGEARVEVIPGTNLVKISVALPRKKIAQLKKAPGAHVYLSVPWGTRPKMFGGLLPSVKFEFLHNPFTVADVDEASGEAVLVARHREGPMTRHLAKLGNGLTPGENPRVTLCVEGPYGTIAKSLPELVDSGADRALIVAGGVGAAFALPVYRAIKAQGQIPNVEMIWAVRSAGDASWPTAASASHDKGSIQSVLEDSNIRVFVTGKSSSLTAAASDVSDNSSQSSSVDAMELQPLNPYGMNGSKRGYTAKRPNLKQLVDDIFKSSGDDERVAVLVCGPEEMTLGTREHVGAWVARGRDVFWHAESFGW